MKILPELLFTQLHIYACGIDLQKGHIGESNMASQSERQTSGSFSTKLATLTIAGGLSFWVANVAISLTPIAAEYRATLSISYLPMLFEALIGGLVIAFCVSYCLLRFFGNIPTMNPILKSVIVSFVGMIVVTLLIEVPAKLLTPTSGALRYFLIGTIFNVLRIFALGIAIGSFYERINGKSGRHARR